MITIMTKFLVCLNMISLGDAVQIAEKYISNFPMLCVVVSVNRFVDGWYFEYQSKENFETGAISHALVSNFPFIVDIDTGELQIMDELVNLPLDSILKAYSENKRIAE